MRDDFNQATKDILANRVGWKCSNPCCRKATRGAGQDKNKYINIGVAAHICAASEGGPRYDANMTKSERKSIENGIWLCQSCSKLIDSDVSQYSIEKLNEWKKEAERIASEDLERSNVSAKKKTITLIINSFLDMDESTGNDEVIITDLKRYFEGRFLKYEYEWETIVNEMKTNIRLYMNKNSQYLVKLTTHYSVAFMAGRILNPKSGMRVIPEQSTNDGIVVWNTKNQKTKKYEKLLINKVERNENNYDVAFVLSITRNIQRAVMNYIEDQRLPIGQIYFCSFELPSIDSVVDGEHAWEITKQINYWIEEGLINKSVTLHIFVAAPISIMFNLGKMSLSYGKGQLYDYDFENKKSGTYSPALYFSEGDWM